MAFNEPRKGFNEPLESEAIRDGQGNLLGYEESKNYMGVKQMYGADGSTVGWSKDASDMGGLPWTIDNHGVRVSQGETPHLLIPQPAPAPSLPSQHIEALDRGKDMDKKEWGL